MSRTNDGGYYRVYFEMEDKSWAHTDILPKFRNYKYWEPIIKSGTGTIVGNLEYKIGRVGKIDADCRPYIIQKKMLLPWVNGTDTFFPKINREEEEDIF